MPAAGLRPGKALALLAVVPLVLLAVVALAGTQTRPLPTTPTGEYVGARNLPLTYTRYEVETVEDSVCVTTQEYGRTVLVILPPGTSAVRSPASVTLPDGRTLTDGGTLGTGIPIRLFTQGGMTPIIPTTDRRILSDALDRDHGGALCGDRHYPFAALL